MCSHNYSDVYPPLYMNLSLEPGTSELSSWIRRALRAPPGSACLASGGGSTRCDLESKQVSGMSFMTIVAPPPQRLRVPHWESGCSREVPVTGQNQTQATLNPLTPKTLKSVTIAGQEPL